MRVVQRILFVVLLSGLMAAQTSPPGGSTSSKLETDVQKLLDAMAAQQKAIADQQKQISDQQQEIEKLKQQVSAQSQTAPPANVQPGQVVNASLTTTGVSPAANTVSDSADPQEKPKESPLSFRIGGAEFTPGGFVDFENIFRTTNTGNVAATNFWAIPFSNSVNAHLTEFRSTGQYSRINLKATTKFKNTDVTGYVEADFNGNDAANVFITSNGHTMRMRLYWVQLRTGKLEFLGGSTWGLQTANRVGISPNPADLSLTFGEDAQTHVGINYTRASEFRVGYHFSDKFVWAVALQNPQQFIGMGNEVIFPSAFNAALTGGNLPQFDNAGNSGAPNVVPDFLTKFAFDTSFAGSHKFHFEAGGLTTSAKIAVIPTLTGATFSKHTKFGAGFFGGFQAEVIKNVRLIGQGMWGNGTGRYLIAMGPQAVVFPTPSTCLSGATGGCNANISMVHAGDALVGVEVLPAPKTQLGFYYGGAYFQRNFFPDLTVAARPNIGFGAPAATGSTLMNRAIQEATVDWTQTFWRNPQYGAVLLVTQTSYVTRSPWFVAAGAPKNAHLTMGYLSLRYVLP